MRRDSEPAGTPDQGEVAHDFTVPDDADLRPVNTADGRSAEDDEDTAR